VTEDLHDYSGVDFEVDEAGGTGAAGVVDGAPADARLGAADCEGSVEIAGLDGGSVGGCEHETAFLLGDPGFGSAGPLLLLTDRTQLEG
jgi:hypothetical protein